MLIYFLILCPILLLFTLQDRINNKINNFFIFSYLIILTIFIGLRHETGGDWDVYLKNFYFYGNNFSIYIRSDLGYEFLSYVVYNLTGNFYFLNLIIASFNIYCLSVFLKNLDNRVLGLIISMPLIILILYMEDQKLQKNLRIYLEYSLEKMKKKNLNKFILI